MKTLKNIKSLPIKTFLIFMSLVICLWTLTFGGDMTVTKVEGLFYLDGTPISIELADGKIYQLIRKASLDDPGLSNVFIAPGLIDNQVNGYVSIGFSSPGLTVETIRTATQALWKAGVTTYLPTVITSSHERLMENFVVLAKAIHDPEISPSVPGFHLEGPYISPVDGYRGAHNKDWVRPPDWNEFLDINKAAENKILQVTLAPEMDGAMDFIHNCVRQGIVVALGHHNGSAEIIKQAIDAGAVIATHLGNGCANMIHRHDNPLWQQLADDRLMASIIVDGFHLRPEEVQVFYKIKGPERIILTSDVTKLAGMPPGEYSYDGRDVVLTPEGCIKFPAQNVLAGAASPISKGVGNIMKFTQCSLADAINMASRNPARLYGFNDRGEIKPGKRADLILFTVDKGVLSIKKTIIAGNVLYAADED
jgi:N-acetylglucosamine-6-phosphate deacetylase